MSKFRDIFRPRQRYARVKPQTAPTQEEAKDQSQTRDMLWSKCPQCKGFIYRKDLERNLGVCDKCHFHFPIGAKERLHQLIDAGTEPELLFNDLVTVDVLGFPDYQAKLARDAEKTDLNDSVVIHRAMIGGHRVILGIMDFGFLGGSMGAVTGERITRAFELATAEGLPVIIVSSSGGARMQEGIISLMQMQKTAAAVELHSRAGLLYISVLTHPTTAGVYGSFASQGDINLAEPGAIVGFAGRPVIEAAIGKRVSPDLQKAETVFANGFIDAIVPRPELKSFLHRLLDFHCEPVVKAEEVEKEPSAAGHESEQNAMQRE
ncbi:MAG: acetyl-CoA carboxylase carboxyl transferase subunit beta [Firmicutes bacterium]|nr:acetyl-CoA carboxylase carboxyl transferase subunit beta [Bacillota bacterium]